MEKGKKRKRIFKRMVGKSQMEEGKMVKGKLREGGRERRNEVKREGCMGEEGELSGSG